MGIPKEFDSVPGPRGPWQQRWLVPLWAVECAFFPINIVILAFLIIITHGGGEDYASDGTAAWNVVDLVMASIALFLTCLEITMYLHRDLTPALYLISCATKILIWSASFIFNIYKFGVAWGQGGYNRWYLLIALVVGLLVYITLIISLAYSIVVYRRSARRMRGFVRSFINVEP